MKNFKFLLITLLSLVLLSCTADNAVTSSSQKQYKIVVTAYVSTNNCYVQSPEYNVLTEFISNDNIMNSFSHTGINPKQFTDEYILNGDIIGVKIKLLNFDSNNVRTGKGLGVQYIIITITENNTEKVVLYKNYLDTFQLLLCDTSTYDGVLLYNTKLNTYTIKTGKHSF